MRAGIGCQHREAWCHPAVCPCKPSAISHRAVQPSTARDISMLTGQSPPAESLTVMATWAVIFGWLSVRMFKWEYNNDAAAACGAVGTSRMGQEARTPTR